MSDDSSNVSGTSSDSGGSADYAGGNDSVTETTTTGWLQRVLGSLVGALIGVVLVIASIVLLWWNEGRAVTAIRALDQGAHHLVEVNATAVDGAAEGKLVHLSGTMQTTKPARDGAFGVGGDNLLRLRRTVEMYQWTEQKSSHSQKNFGGSETTTTTYSYHKEWSEHAKDSSRFHETEGHRNPPMPINSTTIDASDVKLGAYRVDHGLLTEVTAFARFDPAPEAKLPPGYRSAGDFLYRGQDDANPAIGDVRVHYSAVVSQTMSAVAAASAGTLAPFYAANGYKIALAEPGVVPSTQMFKEKAQEESILTWLLRVVGFLLMLLGLFLMANPLSVVLGVIPVLEGIAEIGAFLVALIVAVPLTLIVIAAAWITHRPLLGTAMIAVGLGLAFLLRRLHSKPAPTPTHFLPTSP
jgi:hypothetical protein